jgi:hypothetical protein
MSSLPLILYPSDSGSYLDSLAFTLGREAPASEKKSMIPARRADRHSALYWVLVCSAMTLTAPVDELTLSAEDYPWYLYVPSLELRVSPHLPVLG